MNFRTIYTHDRAVSALYATVNQDENITQQADAKDCDINVIMSRYMNTGQLPQLTEEGRYGDFSQVTDFRTALEAVRAAEALFAEVPAKIRKEFDNDPAKFLEFVDDPNNKEKLYDMGLAQRPEVEPEPAPTPAPIPEPAPVPQPTPVPAPVRK